jgi:hypothetical protein
MTALASSWYRGNPCSTSALASISPAQCALLAASNGVLAGNEGWGYECLQHRDLLIAMEPDRCHPVKAHAVRAPINPSISKGRTEVEPSCLASASSSRPDCRRNGAARLLQRRRLQQHRSILGLEPVDHVAARQGLGGIWFSSCAHSAWMVVSYSQRGYQMCHRRATPRSPSFPRQRNLSSFQR